METLPDALNEVRQKAVAVAEFDDGRHGAVIDRDAAIRRARALGASWGQLRDASGLALGTIATALKQR